MIPPFSESQSLQIDDALKLIAQRGQAINLESVPLDDAVTYERVFHTGLTSGIFQF